MIRTAAPLPCPAHPRAEPPAGRPTPSAARPLGRRAARDAAAARQAAVLLLAALPLAACGRGPVPEAAASGASAAAAGPGGGPTLADSMAGWYALGLTSHHLCAGLWVVGRDHPRTPEDVVAQDIAPFPPFRWGDDFTWEVDEARHAVTVSAPGVGARTARYSGDQGCAILPAGADDVFFEPAPVAPALPDPEGQDWPTGDRNAAADFPEVDRAALDAALAWGLDDSGPGTPQNTRAIVVLYRGRLVGEAYAPGWGPYTPQISWSMGKSVAAALTGVMVQRGFYGLDEPAPVAEWQGARDPRRNIRIRDLLQMSSGLDFDNFGLDPDESYNAANEHFRLYFDALNTGLHAINQPLRYEPGTVFRYRNSDPLSLMLVARRTLEARGEDWLSFPQRQLFDRIGIRSMVLETDPYGNFLITGYDFGGARDWARFGLLHLRDGVWEGERILPEGWTDFVSSPAPGDPDRGYGGLFWLNRGGDMERAPADAYWAAGYMGQRTTVIPSRDMVIVRLGPSPGGFGGYIDELTGRILDAVGTPAADGSGG